MHVRPYVVVDGCGNAADALVRTHIHTDGWLPPGGPYDYGGPLVPGRDGKLGDIAIPAGTPKYRGAVGSALEAERRAAGEQWEVLRQAMDAFGRSEAPPGLEETFRARYRTGLGLAGLPAGTEIDGDETFSHALWRAGHLSDLLEGRPCASRFLYDRREQDTAPLLAEERPDVYAVLCDFHL